VLDAHRLIEEFMVWPIVQAARRCWCARKTPTASTHSRRTLAAKLAALRETAQAAAITFGQGAGADTAPLLKTNSNGARAGTDDAELINLSSAVDRTQAYYGPAPHRALWSGAGGPMLHFTSSDTALCGSDRWCTRADHCTRLGQRRAEPASDIEHIEQTGRTISRTTNAVIGARAETPRTVIWRLICSETVGN